ncbi:MAG: TatD family hydrolase [Muribaculaceae bacterium]|nr:TatD family hydrolase [Muribaculaceae bacterium]
MTDTHTHLYMSDYEDGGVLAVERAISSGVGMMIFPGVDFDSIAPMTILHRRYPANTRIAIGLHPTELGDNPGSILDRMEDILEASPESFSAIGETGIDLYWDKSNPEGQKEAFSRQYDWAVRHGLPLIIHCREGLGEALEVIASKTGERPKMIFHSFTYGPEEVRRIREVCDPWFGINGVVTFKNAAKVREALPEIGLDRIVLETDSPYLAPVPHRGERNESSYLGSVRDKTAEVLGLSPEEVERVTDANAKEIFTL